MSFSKFKGKLTLSGWDFHFSAILLIKEEKDDLQFEAGLLKVNPQHCEVTHEEHEHPQCCHRLVNFVVILRCYKMW